VDAAREYGPYNEPSPIDRIGIHRQRDITEDQIHRRSLGCGTQPSWRADAELGMLGGLTELKGGCRKVECWPDPLDPTPVGMTLDRQANEHRLSVCPHNGDEDRFSHRRLSAG
jgi:hypothetical protein